MASNSETGHPINVANLEDVISFVTGYGALYNPSKNAIKLPQLNILFTSSKSSLATVNTTLTPYNNAVNARAIVFEPISILTTRIINALGATDATAQVIKNANTIAHKIQGKRATPIAKPQKGQLQTPPIPLIAVTPPVNPLDATNISASQLSFDSKVENFAKLITLLTNEPFYVPNETDLKLTTLNTLLTSLKTTNTAVIAATTPLSNARIARNKILYNPTTGLYDIQKAVKKYVLSVFKARSPEYKQISKIKFTNHKPKK
jgi:hypothetical protein